MQQFTIQSIGTVRNSRPAISDDFWGGVVSEIQLHDPFGPEALHGLTDFSHVEVIYVFDKAMGGPMVTGSEHPRENPAWPKVGIFAQRKKSRPNWLGATICPIVKVEGRSLFVQLLDAIDGTPVIDLKPVMQEFLPQTPVRQPQWSVELMREYWLNG
jgi:tRNA (adenine37-N6)-methyltransferase